MNKRKDMNTRRHYSNIKICYDCSGTKEISDNCDIGKYSYNEKLEKCTWKLTIENDLEKLAKGIEPLTFPILKKITETFI